jgi:serine/threonine-protein kinase
LEEGTRLSHYEIISRIGAGGMGEVYLANDSKLDRKVAIKILPETVTRDMERVARFEREAKLLASLNHPNIAAIHGFDESEGKRFLVMEYVEGETLGSHLDKGPVAVEDALDMAKKIAEALEAAHGQGIIHRDLKPANVMIRQDGAVKVLDFGLAKAITEETSGSEQANSPTITANYTRPGVVLGTAAYMSPEQARGRALDKRTDIWSLGIILFECLTGDRLFQGETANDSMGAIMHKEPEWSRLPESTPPTIQLMLRRCLTKDRKRRLHDIADARIELENALIDPSSTSLGLAQAALQIKSRSRVVQALPWLIAMVALVGLAVVLWRAGDRTASVVSRLTVDIPDDVGLFPWSSPVLSLDGSQLSFSGQRDGMVLVYVRDMTLGETRALEGTDQSIGKAFSPDGEWISFGYKNKLRKLSLRGGPATTLCDVEALRGHAWLTDGTIVLAPDRVGGLYSVAEGGGPLTPFTTVAADKPGVSHRHPHVLPDGKGILFVETHDGGEWDETSLFVVPLDGGDPRVLVRRATEGRYIPPGYLVFLRETTLMAVPFDLDRLELTGSAIPVVDGVASPLPSAPAQFSISDNGTLVYLPDTGSSDSQLVKVDFTGKITSLSPVTAEYDDYELSPDGTRVAAIIDSETGSEELVILDLRRNLLRPAGDDGTSYSRVVWSPDGKWIVFSSSKDGDAFNLYRIRADFSGVTERLMVDTKYQRPYAFSPDGRMLIFSQDSDTVTDLMMLQFDENGAVVGKPEPFMTRPEWQCCASFSPDGHWVVFGSGETGTSQLFVKSVEGGAATEQISNGIRVDAGSFSPVENKIFFEAWGSHSSPAVFSIDYTIEDGRFEVSAAPDELFDLNSSLDTPDGAQVMPDGKHILALQSVSGSDQKIEPRIIVNWVEELKAKVPIK